MNKNQNYNPLNNEVQQTDPLMLLWYNFWPCWWRQTRHCQDCPGQELQSCPPASRLPHARSSEQSKESAPFAVSSTWAPGTQMGLGSALQTGRRQNASTLWCSSGPQHSLGSPAGTETVEMSHMHYTITERIHRITEFVLNNVQGLMGYMKGSE